MKQVIVNTPFDGSKFAARYNLTAFDFSMAGNILSFPDFVPDNPVIEPPDPPQPRGKLIWEAGPVDGTVRLVATFNGKSSSIVVAGQDTSVYAMFASPGPTDVSGHVRRKEFHLTGVENIAQLAPTPLEGDTLHIAGNGQYTLHADTNWHRMLSGPALGAPSDKVNLYGDLFTAIDALSVGGPPVHPKVITAFNELKKVLGG